MSIATSSLRALVVAAVLPAVAGCGLHGQLGDLLAFVTSDFRLRAVDHARLAGVDVRDLRRPADLGADDLARLAVTAASGTFPLDLRLVLESENRSSAPAIIRQFDWRLTLDDEDVASGLSPETIELPARGSQAFPFDVRADLRSWVRGRTRDGLADLVVGLFDPDRTQPRLVLSIRPTFEVLGREQRAPRFIDVPIRVPRVSVRDPRGRR